jgi:hypothetical protein
MLGTDQLGETIDPDDDDLVGQADVEGAPISGSSQLRRSTGESMVTTKPILEALAALENACRQSDPADGDHVVFFHSREIVLDIVRHHDTLAALAASAGKLSRADILRALNELRLEIVTGTLPHWQQHLDELEMELQRRLPDEDE